MLQFDENFSICTQNCICKKFTCVFEPKVYSKLNNFVFEWFVGTNVLELAIFGGIFCDVIGDFGATKMYVHFPLFPNLHQFVTCIQTSNNQNDQSILDETLYFAYNCTNNHWRPKPQPMDSSTTLRLFQQRCGMWRSLNLSKTHFNCQTLCN